jgi:small subunit ribosomal protein S2
MEEAIRCGMPYVTERWLGGMLTNWSTMYQRIQELERLEQLRDSGEINRLTKKEGLLIEREITRLNTRLAGVRKMKKLPNLLFIIDVGREVSAVNEANLLNIPIVALVDTNCNPQPVDYVIPSNDDAIRAIKLLVSKMADAVLEGKAARKDEEPEQVEDVRAVSKAPIRPARSKVMIEADDDADDDILLGEATLAKMNVGKKADIAIEDAIEEVKEKKSREKNSEDVEESKSEE